MINCKRFYRRLGESITNGFLLDGYGNGSVSTMVGYLPMRADPTAIQVGTWTSSNVSAVGYIPQKEMLTAYISLASLGAGYVQTTPGAYLMLDARL